MIETESQDPRLPKGDFRAVPRWPVGNIEYRFTDDVIEGWPGTEMDCFTKEIIEMFLEEDMRDWSSEWPWFERPPTLEEAALSAVRRAIEGDPSDLIRFTEEWVLSRRKKRGRPPGVRMFLADRVARNPIHRAASMVGLVEQILKSWYPDGRKYIRPLACDVVAAMWHCHTPEGARPKQWAVTRENLLYHLARSSRSRLT
jgi:hypothetical protein